MSKFEVGDIVEAFGLRGVVTGIYLDRSITEACLVKFDEPLDASALDSYHYFTLNGFAKTWHKTPSLVLIERPKRKVTKTLRGFVNVYSYMESVVYRTRDAADARAGEGRIACVEVTGSYEVEE